MCENPIYLGLTLTDSDYLSTEQAMNSETWIMKDATDWEYGNGGVKSEI